MISDNERWLVRVAAVVRAAATSVPRAVLVPLAVSGLLVISLMTESEAARQCLVFIVWAIILTAGPNAWRLGPLDRVDRKQTPVDTGYAFSAVGAGLSALVAVSIAIAWVVFLVDAGPSAAAANFGLHYAVLVFLGTLYVPVSILAHDLLLAAIVFRSLEAEFLARLMGGNVIVTARLPANGGWSPITNPYRHFDVLEPAAAAVDDAEEGRHIIVT